MGCDGGSIPRRDELVKLKKKAEKVDPQEVERIKWFTCAMSNDRLKEPIVACELGHLYNKEAVIRALLDKNIEERFNHIRSLKDLITPRFTPNPAFDSSAAETDDFSKKSPFLCPITQEEVGRVSFSLLRNCGCVISERALREVPSPTCVQCGVAFAQEDVIVLNPDEEEKKALRARMEARRGSEKGKKKEKRDKRKKEKADKSEKQEKAENGESSKFEKREKAENGIKEKAGNGKAVASTDKDTLIGKKREVESSSSSQPPTKASKLSSKSSSSTTTTTTTSTATYTSNVTPHSGERTEDDLKAPATISVAKTSAYNSIFKSNRPSQTSNNLFSGIY